MTLSQNQTQTSKLVGLLAQFDDPDSLVHACDKARLDGYKVMDAYSPFPVHGIDPAIGIRRTWLPFFVLSIALLAVTVGLGMQYYTNKVEGSPLFPGYAFKISGKPLFSLPANIPVTFEVIVLSSAFATFFGMWVLNILPRLSNPLHRIERFKRATNDKFFLMIESADPKFNSGRTESQLKEWGAVAIDECRQDLTDNQLPAWIKMAGITLAILLLLPPIAIFRAAGLKSRAPRMHFNPDMDWQIKFKAQTMSPTITNSPTEKDKQYLFADMRANRAPVVGSVAWGQLDNNPETHQGIKADYTGSGAEEDLTKYVTGFPDDITVDEALLKRGRQRFEIYCSVCHGYAGTGNGLVNVRAGALNLEGKATWTTAKSLHDPAVKNPEKNPLGRIFETISNGRNTMGPYRSQITVKDRWAIVAYVKALQEMGIETDLAVTAAVDSAAGDAAGPDNLGTDQESLK
jgi:mono/diheme cytochrome c family protein